MCKFNPKNRGRRMDKCMRQLIESLNIFDVRTVACCCGHGRYPMTIVAESGGDYFELLSGMMIERSKRFYRRDKKGYYYIPEACNEVV